MQGRGGQGRMTNKDKQDVISVCNILADKMSDSGKVAVQQIIGAVEDMVENELCEGCISLNKLDDIITKAIDDSENQTECQTLRWVLDVMSELSSVIPKPKVGKWIKTYEPNDAEPCILWMCSKCQKAERGRRSKYCPNCGAKMEGE